MVSNVEDVGMILVIILKKFRMESYIIIKTIFVSIYI
jgi:hypothetical protein